VNRNFENFPKKFQEFAKKSKIWGLCLQTSKCAQKYFKEFFQNLGLMPLFQNVPKNMWELSHSPQLGP
jgi:hypothetical protein